MHLAGSAEHGGAAETRKILRAVELLTAWRYRTPECPACRQTPHAADCVLLAVLEVLT